MGVELLGLVHEFTVDGVFLFPFYGHGDCLVAFVAGNNPDAFFTKISFFHVFLLLVVVEHWMGMSGVISQLWLPEFREHEVPSSRVQWHGGRR